MKYSGHIYLEVFQNVNSFRAECSCRWFSPFYGSEPIAARAGMQHAEDEHGVNLRRCS